jgi:hypothetical protein
MHLPVSDNLEEYLSRRGDCEMPGEMAAHLQECRSCVRELAQIEEQAAMLRSLRAGTCEPSPGFYARVMDRIDRTDDSIWAVLLMPALGRRIVIASSALVLLLGSYLITSEAETTPPSPQEIGQQNTLPQQRDAVLVSLASYRE